MFEHPDQVIGKTINLAPLYTNYHELIRAFEETTGKKAVFTGIPLDKWFDNLRAYKDPWSKLPPNALMDDDTVFTFRQTFGGWWHLWKHNSRDEDSEKKTNQFADAIHPKRLRTIKEWMLAVSYTGM
jgi:hypothetical protein